MSNTVIKVENLSKLYRLGLISSRTLRDDLRRRWASFRNKPDPLLKVTDARHASSNNPKSKIQNSKSDESIWALKDINLEVKQGEVLGIIGKNGAGKSTLLKILARVTAPTNGNVYLKGRVASLLEVGTGFHPELTGKENIYLNGAILGMKKSEITRKLDEIVAFAEIAKFIDTPVKRYSSGMYVRLAFAVAAHLEPEIMIVDEVLAVGDAEFQKKCLGKMGDVSREGRTVLFVSHNMGAVRQLCPKSLWLREGRVAGIDNTLKVVEDYLGDQRNGDYDGIMQFAEDLKKPFQILQIDLQRANGETSAVFECDEPVHIVLYAVSRQPIPALYGYMTISRNDGTVVLESDSTEIQPNRFENLSFGKYTFKIIIPARLLGIGKYNMHLSFGSYRTNTGFIVDSLDVASIFTLADNSTKRGNRRNGFLSTLIEWHNDTDSFYYIS